MLNMQTLMSMRILIEYESLSLDSSSVSDIQLPFNCGPDGVHAL